jgi:pyruvate ferredoxin oxidoreductase beta subunit
MDPKTLAEKLSKEQKLTSGHRMCGGCAAPIIVKSILASTDSPIVASNATGCLEVATTIYPYTSWNIPWIHSAFENAPATISGVLAAYEAKKRKGEIKEDVKFIAFGGDGSSYDIGIQSLSGALERGEDFVYVCYDNEGYMNTGGQRSGATPLGAAATTDPAGKKRPGKQEFKKDLVKIAAAHNIPYAAQASVSNLVDLTNKAEKAFKVKGPAVLVVLSTCPTLWGTLPAQTIELAKMAVDSCMWPLYEVENGKYRLTYKPSNKIPVTDFIKPQRRFRHLFMPGNEYMIEKLQKGVDERWESLLELCGEKK